MKRFGIVAAAVMLALGGCGTMQGQPGGGWVKLVDASGFAGMNQIGNANWRVADGAVVSDKGVGFLVTPQQYVDFELRAEFYAESDTNSGIFIRCNDRVKITSETCYEVNIWDVRPKPEYGTGAMVDVPGAAVTPQMPKAGGKWNTYVVTAKGDHFTVTLNGVKTVDVRNAKHAKGAIGLQRAPGVKKEAETPIKWRKVQIRAL